MLAAGKFIDPHKSHMIIPTLITILIIIILYCLIIDPA